MPMRMKRIVLLDGLPSEVPFASVFCVALGDAEGVGVIAGEAVADGDGEGDAEGVAVAVETVRALEAVAFMVVSSCATTVTEYVPGCVLAGMGRETLRLPFASGVAL